MCPPFKPPPPVPPASSSGPIRYNLDTPYPAYKAPPPEHMLNDLPLQAVYERIMGHHSIGTMADPEVTRHGEPPPLCTSRPAETATTWSTTATDYGTLYVLKLAGLVNIAASRRTTPSTRRGDSRCA